MMRVVNIVDDDAIMRNAAADYLEASGFTLRKFGAAAEFINSVPVSELSVTLIPFSLAGGQGLEFLDRLNQLRYETAVVMISDCEETLQIVQAMKIGATDILEKPFHCQELEQMVCSAFKTSAKVSGLTRVELGGSDAVIDSLSQEEDTILTLLCQGWTVKQVAAKLDVSVRTVHYRKNSIFGKLGVKNRTEAMSRLASLGLPRGQELLSS